MVIQPLETFFAVSTEEISSLESETQRTKTPAEGAADQRHSEIVVPCLLVCCAVQRCFNPAASSLLLCPPLLALPEQLRFGEQHFLCLAHHSRHKARIRIPLSIGCRIS